MLIHADIRSHYTMRKTPIACGVGVQKYGTRPSVVFVSRSYPIENPRIRMKRDEWKTNVLFRSFVCWFFDSFCQRCPTIIRNILWETSVTVLVFRTKATGETTARAVTHESASADVDFRNHRYPSAYCVHRRVRTV